MKAKQNSKKKDLKQVWGAANRSGALQNKET
jgi:hypothetical protein